jgi:predicted aldo/keto reductase-like oxidoreductase
MQYRRFGRTELQMPVFSCGGMRYQAGWGDIDPEAIEKAQQENLEATIDRSLEVGINTSKRRAATAPAKCNSVGFCPNCRAKR